VTTTPTPTTTCPSWCDPRSHAVNDTHGSTPITHQAVYDDVEISMAVRSTGTSTRVTLDIRNLVSQWPGGAPIEAGVELLPAEAELIAHRLLLLASLGRGGAR
jgi:hypothetical protein